jgi:hypothetical protein
VLTPLCTPAPPSMHMLADADRVLSPADNGEQAASSEHGSEIGSEIEDEDDGKGGGEGAEPGSADAFDDMDAALDDAAAGGASGSSGGSSGQDDSSADTDNSGSGSDGDGIGTGRASFLQGEKSASFSKAFAKIMAKPAKRDEAKPSGAVDVILSESASLAKRRVEAAADESAARAAKKQRLEMRKRGHMVRAFSEDTCVRVCLVPCRRVTMERGCNAVASSGMAAAQVLAWGECVRGRSGGVPGARGSTL